jgi:hypothetical protein
LVISRWWSCHAALAALFFSASRYVLGACSGFQPKRCLSYNIPILRVAIVGASRIAARTLPAWRTIPDIYIAGVYSRNITAAREISHMGALVEQSPVAAVRSLISGVI